MVGFKSHPFLVLSLVINPFEANDYPSGIEKLSVWFPITGGPPETELFLTCLYFMFDLDS